MRCLIASADNSIRDTIVAAAHAFQGVECDAVDAATGRLNLRRRKYDFAFVVLASVGEGPAAEEANTLITELRELAPTLPVIGVARQAALSVLRSEKNKQNLFSLIGSPPDTLELYRTIRRVLDRLRTPARSARVSAPRE